MEECEKEEEVSHIRQFFPRYKDSKIKGMAEDFHGAQGRLGNHNTGNPIERNRKARVKASLEAQLEEERLAEERKKKDRKKKKKKKKKRKDKKAATAIRDNDEL